MLSVDQVALSSSLIILFTLNFEGHLFVISLSKLGHHCIVIWCSKLNVILHFVLDWG